MSLVVAAMFVASAPVSAQLITAVDFEAGTQVGYTTSIAEQSDGAADYFTHSVNGTNIGGVYTGAQGTSFFAAQDTDADGGVSPASLFISNVNISNFNNLNLELLVAEDDDGVNEDWDDSDSFTVFASIDGGAQFQIFGIENDGSTFNSAPQIDTDFDGTGDGTVITNTFTDFTATIAGTGSTLDLEFIFALDSGDEDLAIDNIRINGTTVPELSLIHI